MLMSVRYRPVAGPSDVQRVVLVSGPDGDTRRAVAAAFDQAGDVVVTSDESEAGSVDALVSGIIDDHDRLDIVVTLSAPAAEDADATVRGSLLAPVIVSTRANLEMRRAGSGVIIHVIDARRDGESAAVSAARAGLLSFTQSLAIEWGPAVRLASVVHDTDAARAVGTIPVGRAGTSSDVAEACRWLASGAASFLSGTAITLNGGGVLPVALDALD